MTRWNLAGIARPSSIRIVLTIGAVAGTAVGTGWLVAIAGETPEAPEKKEVRVVVVGDDGNVVKVATDDDSDRKGAFLGVSTGEDTESADGGAKVESVVDGSPADEAGIRRGDTIVGFDGTVIRGPGKLSEKIHASKAGEKVQLKVVRKDGAKDTVTVKLGERPRKVAYWYGYGDDGPQSVPLPDLEDLHENLKHLGKDLRVKSFRLPHGLGGFDRPRLGVELVETTPELREFLGAGREAGVIVGKVLSGTPAERAGVHVGDVIVALDGEEIEDAGDLIDELSKKEGSTINLEVIRDKRSLRLSVPIPKQDEDSDEDVAGPRAFHERDEPAREVARQVQAAIAQSVALASARADEALARALANRGVAERAAESARQEARRSARRVRERARTWNAI